jgi:hypothetical protein
VIDQFSKAGFEDFHARRVDESELIRMHRDSNMMIFDEISDPSELSSEMFLPVELADRMRSKRDNIRSDSEKQYLLLDVEPKYLEKASQVVLNCFHQPVFRV